MVAPLSKFLGVAGGAGGFGSLYQQAPVTHLLFMDDLKVYEESQVELESTLEVVERLAGAVGMTLGVWKCAVAHLRAGRVRQRERASTSRSEIQEIGRGDTYKYLGVQQVFGPCSREIKTAVVAEYLRRVQIVWSSSLSAAEKVRVHNTWAAAVLRYTGFSSNILKTP